MPPLLGVTSGTMYVSVERFTLLLYRCITAPHGTPYYIFDAHGARWGFPVVTRGRKERTYPYKGQQVLNVHSIHSTGVFVAGND